MLVVTQQMTDVARIAKNRLQCLDGKESGFVLLHRLQRWIAMANDGRLTSQKIIMVLC